MIKNNSIRFLKLFGLLFIAFWSQTTGAIVVGPGTTIRVDFDFNGDYSPPYYNMMGRFYFGDSNLLDTGEGWTIRTFDEENGPVLETFIFSSTFPSTANVNMSVFDYYTDSYYTVGPPAFYDGKGFLLITDVIGSFNLTSVLFSGNNSFGYEGDVEGIISAVPVPQSVWLFGSGLIALFGLSRSKV